MNDTSSSDFSLLVLLIPVGLWLINSAVSTLISGWFSLARRFRAMSRPDGQKVTGQVRMMGAVPQSGVTYMIVSDSGLYLYVGFLFRFLHPAFLIPWREVRLVREIKTLWWYSYELDFARITTLRITRKAYEAIQKHVTPGAVTAE